MAPRYPDITVDLSGVDGNVYAIIGAVYNAIKEGGLHKEAQQFKRQCFKAGSYDEILQLAVSTVNAEYDNE